MLSQPVMYPRSLHSLVAAVGIFLSAPVCLVSAQDIPATDGSTGSGPVSGSTETPSAIPASFPTPSEIIEGRIHQSAEQQELYRLTCNSVVRIEKADALGTTMATGFFVDENGLVATVISTNRHPDTITVTWQGRPYHGKLLAIDERTRLALVKTDAERTPALTLASGLDLAIGASLYAVNDGADTVERLSAGRLAGREGTLQGQLLPTTILRLHIGAAPEAFGAPVLDSNGHVVAILLLNLDEQNEVCFALPAEILHKVRADCERFQHVEPAWCGFTLELGTTTPKVIFVQDDSPAAAAGFRQGDVILRIGERSVVNYQEVVDRCYYLTAGAEVEFAVLRGRTDRILKLTPKPLSQFTRGSN